MDMSKTPAARAVDELLKAQHTHIKLKRQFEEAKVKEDLADMKQVSWLAENQYTTNCVQQQSGHNDVIVYSIQQVSGLYVP